MLRWLLLAVACLGVHAEDCPWLNTATAAGALGGAVTEVAVKHAAAGDDASCRFLRRQGSLVLELSIEIETMQSPAKDFAHYLARCAGADSVALKGIGNEALACRTSAGDGEQVISRVRERAFVVRMQSSDRSVELREKVRKIAELVAGFLF